MGPSCNKTFKLGVGDTSLYVGIEVYILSANTWALHVLCTICVEVYSESGFPRL